MTLEHKHLDSKTKEMVNKIIEDNTKLFIKKYGKKTKKKIIKKKIKKYFQQMKK